MKPVVNGRASICTWELEFHFRDKDQIRRFIRMLLDDEVDFDFEYKKILNETCTLHYVTVQGSWANNLVQVAKMAEVVDYKDD